MQPTASGELTPHERRMRGVDGNRRPTRSAYESAALPEPVIAPLDNNPSLVDPTISPTPDQQRDARFYQQNEAAQTAVLLSSVPMATEEVVVSAPRMTPQEVRAYDARDGLRTTLNGILSVHRREQEARNMVEAEMTTSQRALVSLGGIMYNGYQSVKSGVVGLKDLAVSAYEWDQRVIGDLLHGDFRAAAGEYTDLFGLGVEKAKALVAGAHNLGTVLADAESRDMLLDFAKEYYGASSQVTQSELLGKLPMELLIAAGTAGAGEVISAAGIPQRIGGALNALADTLRAVDVRSPLLPVEIGRDMGMFGIKGVQSPFVVNNTSAQLLPGEGLVDTYDDLIAGGVKGDNLTPHHIPSARHMANLGIRRGEGISINMEQPTPGLGGRHRRTFTYGTDADVHLSSRDALAAGIRDVRRIYQQDGLYDPYIRGQLQRVIDRNLAAHPQVFKKQP